MQSLMHSKTEKSPKSISSADSADAVQSGDWRIYFKHGEDFLGAACRDRAGKQRFSGDVIFDLISLAVENFLYAGCLAHGHLPVNGCLVALAQETGEIVSLSAGCRESISTLVGMKDICSLFPSEDVLPVPDAKIPALVNIGVIVCNEITRVLDSVQSVGDAAVSSSRKRIFPGEVSHARKGA